MTVILSILLGLAGSIIIAGLAYWKRSLSRSGFVAAVVLGTALYAVSNLAWYGTLIAFFISSSLLSKVNHRRKKQAEQHYEKGDRRDAAQVAANGAIPLVLAIGYVLEPHIAWWYAYLGSLAAVTADTWATELGALSRKQPRSILTGRRVQSGTSGGVSLAGLVASLAGGCLIGAVAYLLTRIQGGSADGFIALDVSWIILSGCAGLFGSVADSFLGATIQAEYKCRQCGQMTEKAVHCHVTAELRKGWRFVHNDQVNAAAALCGALFASCFGLLML